MTDSGGILGCDCWGGLEPEIRPLGHSAEKLLPLCITGWPEIRLSWNVRNPFLICSIFFPHDLDGLFWILFRLATDSDSGATFTNLPTKQLLTLNMDTPRTWLVQPVAAVYDLDNIRLGEMGDNHLLSARFKLEHILAEGPFLLEV